MDIDLSRPFRGSTAVSAGRVTKGQLRGPRFQRLLPDIYAPAHAVPDLALRSHAAYVLVEGRGVVAGYSAAELLDASCAPFGVPATVLMLPGQQRRRTPDLVVRRDHLHLEELTIRGGTILTSPVRTAFDLARWAPTLTEKVVAVDALAHRHGLTADDVRSLARRHSGVHGGADLPSVLRLMNCLAESPMESRIRLALELGGLPAPAVQHRVIGRGLSFRLDLAYPAVLLAVEYDGGHHLRPERARRDLSREAALTAIGWKVLRFGADTVHQRPDEIAAVTRAELRARGMAA